MFDACNHLSLCTVTADALGITGVGVRRSAVSDINIDTDDAATPLLSLFAGGSWTTDSSSPLPFISPFAKGVQYVTSFVPVNSLENLAGVAVGRDGVTGDGVKTVVRVRGWGTDGGGGGCRSGGGRERGRDSGADAVL